MILLSLKHLITSLTLSVFAYSSTTVPAIEALEQTSKAFVFWDVNAKKRLADKNADTLIHPASLTKIMTSIIAIESGMLDKIITITPEMTKVKPTRLGFKVGESFYIRDLVKAAMIESDNDAALAVAIAVGGSEKRFVDLMNSKAKSLGMKNTNFENPHGFDHPQHLTTANDLLKLTDYALKNSYFDDIISLKEYAFHDMTTSKVYKVRTHNLLLKNYPYALGVKTGFTNQAGPCLIARVKKNGEDLVLVMLDARANRWKTAQAVFESQLGNPQMLTVAPTKTFAEQTNKIVKKRKVSQKKVLKKTKNYALASTKSLKTRTK